ncbi:MAG TPA: DUF1905 domain-containing protein [Acidobacteriaceae bacterium]|jgi:hypothetical protein|nr:DUF1905 domain-containing protein [Acidobacteriaceae bacterium]
MAITTFQARIRKSPAKGGHTYVVWPESVRFFQTRGLVKVRGTFNGVPFRSSFMPLGNGTHKLPVTAAALKTMGKTEGNLVTVVIEERLAPVPARRPAARLLDEQ